MMLSMDEIKQRLNAMTFDLGQGDAVTLSFSFTTQLRFGVHFLQRIRIAKRYGTVIGELIVPGCEPQLYVWWDQSPHPAPLPLRTTLLKEIDSFNRMHPLQVVKYMAKRFNNCPIKTLMMAGNYPLGPNDLPSLFHTNQLSVIERGEEHWSDWLVMACFYFETVSQGIETYLQSHAQLPLDVMEAVGAYSIDSGLDWQDFPLFYSSQDIASEIDGINRQLDYLQSQATLPAALTSQRESREKLVALLMAPLQERHALLKQYQRVPLMRAWQEEPKQLQAKQTFERLFSNLHYRHFDAHSRIMQFLFNTWIEIQGQLNDHQQGQNQVILQKLSEYAYHEALKETPLAGRDVGQDSSPWPPYYLWAFVFALSQGDAFVKKTCTHLLINALLPEHVDRLVLIDFEQWCEKNQAGVCLLHDHLLKNEHFNRLRGELFAHGQQTFQFEMVKLMFYAVKAMVALNKATPEIAAARFANEALPALSELILNGHQPAIDFIVAGLQEPSQIGVFFGLDYNLAIALVSHYVDDNDLPKAWSFFRRLEQFTCASGIKRQALATETVALLHIVFDDKAREAGLHVLIEQAKFGASDLMKDEAVNALQRAGQLIPVAALACVRYFIEVREPRDNRILKFMRLAAEADPAETAYLNYLFLRQRKMMAPESLIKAASWGHRLACSELENYMGRYVEEKNTELVKDFFIPALLDGKIQKYLPCDLVVKTVILMIDTQTEDDKPAYTAKMMSLFIRALKRENPPNRNTLITMLLAKSEGRFSAEQCNELSQAIDHSLLPEKALTTPEAQGVASLSFARKKGLFVREKLSKEINDTREPPASSPGTPPL
ncbi:hypothetical protein GH742_01360 [Legionella sp. MW5194]|uniref:hypothetical protein n=1 Tax=Legionella sp. MW5194 TaxID=2662448 RepID=UPI00193E531F|nr:hypothetical protein [Legionella sp. MW5194]QRN02629.1 hypothetical protein GH742_01360 [Legionella sp. MW5194]